MAVGFLLSPLSGCDDESFPGKKPDAEWLSLVLKYTEEPLIEIHTDELYTLKRVALFALRECEEEIANIR